MANYTKDIKPLEDEGKTDAEILAALQADTRHFKNIMATGDGSRDLLHILTGKFKVLRLNTEAVWVGPLVDFMKLETTPTVLKEGFELLLSHLQISEREVYCSSDPATGYLVTAIAQVVDQLSQGMGRSAGEVVTAVYAVTGGPLWASLTEQEIADCRTEYQVEHSELSRRQSIEQLQAEIENDYINVAIVDGVTTVDQVRTAIKAGL